MNEDRYVLPNLTKPALRLVAWRVMRFYFLGLSLKEALDRATEYLRHG